eukprot:CAMPEP_0194144630 /NCGR_PEP_ID=MMETSP0152-20130528/13659_1 /TAXON_ID=1049557 /ORGANISM="Thalassiothrix antarctica, Strain L6-D1" /LENGTH=1070 /DNA_ID=CAMNT_0038844571 /DNA_START=92 /DNA_END=3301 /DNA_ORIENTATION=+
MMRLAFSRLTTSNNNARVALSSSRSYYHRRRHLREFTGCFQLRSAVSETAPALNFVEGEENNKCDGSLVNTTTTNPINTSSSLSELIPPEKTPPVTTTDDLPEYVACTIPKNPSDEEEVYNGTPSDDDVLLKGLESRPIANGNWNLKDPVLWSQTFGRRSVATAQQLAPKIKLGPGDEGYFDVSDLRIPQVTIVRTKEEAQIVLEKLKNASKDLFHACDTEVMDIDLKRVGPVGNGYVTCASIYSGPDFDYGLGDGPGTVLWIDNLDDSVGILQEFKEWFEDPNHLKVWHNYGFDRHVLWNEGINCLGFGGDTMHMARLQDTSRAKYGTGKGYSLSALTEDLLDRRKKPMKEIFGIPRIKKDGTPGALLDMPSVEVMQRDPKHREKWIVYSAYDAEGTWLIRKKLQEKLEKMTWMHGEDLYYYYHTYMRPFGEVLTDMERRGIRVDAKDYLAGVEVQARKDRAHHVEVFRNWAEKQIGPDGLAMNIASSTQLSTFLYGGATNEKTNEETEKVRVFKVPRAEVRDDAMEAYRKQNEQNKGEDDEPEKDLFEHMKATQLKALCKQRGIKVSGKKSELIERLRGHFLTVEESDEGKETDPDDFDSMPDEDLRHALLARGLQNSGTRKQLLQSLREDSAYTMELLSAAQPKDKNSYNVISEALKAAAHKDGGTLKEILDEVQEKLSAEPKFVEVKITSIGMEPFKFTTGGAPSVTADVIRKLAGDPSSGTYGTAYDFFNGGEVGHEACEALFSLGAVGSIDTMIANFLKSLQYLADEQSRVHGSVNLNTETGRLSSRRPNLQNQPALEKDKYKIRKAFQSSPGNSLIVADYGQLELRLLASMTKCKSMIEAFNLGGDFHSRTALDMFDYVQDKVDAGECLLEWDYANGDPPKPLLKDIFASERRKAKTLNFSIAYGKTAHGLSADWGVSRNEAEDMLQAWYKARPEVLKWQKNTKKYARKHLVTRTMMGRYRQLPEAGGRNYKLVGHAERASINTPIQGGAADVVMMAMIKINDSEKLKRLGWILLMQIHDEVIMEGPEETAKEAFREVITCMEAPWVLGLEETRVPLLVDGSY